MKYQPLYVPDDTEENRALRKRFSLSNMTDDDWTVFEKQVGDLVRFERFMRKPGTRVIYPFFENNLEYLRSLKKFYQEGTRINQCDTAPIIVVGSDGLVHPCMFLFHQVIGNILSDSPP